ncbi:MAG: M23 family metallopeptidase [Sphingobacteriales bacterium]|nr:M23 family metallopeptidase [Sphingobacteriales bacterium]
MALLFFMKYLQLPLLFTFIISIIGISSCTYTKIPQRKETKLLVKGKVVDTTSYVYDLPYPKGMSFRLVQDYYTHLTHKRRAALDFRMPIGSTVCAAREGVIYKTKQDGTKGGFQRSDRSFANYIIIEHVDGSRAGYWHLRRNSIFVNVGDSVLKGQPIALSGNTGLTFFPHLHFIVWSFDKDRNFLQQPTRFRTQKEIDI